MITSESIEIFRLQVIFGTAPETVTWTDIPVNCEKCEIAKNAELRKMRKCGIANVLVTPEVVTIEVAVCPVMFVKLFEDVDEVMVVEALVAMYGVV